MAASTPPPPNPRRSPSTSPRRQEDATRTSPRLVASARDIADTDDRDTGVAKRNNFYQDVQWTPDGTSMITHRADQTLSTLVLPPDLLNSPEPHILEPYSTLSAPSRVRAYTCYPYYNLDDTSTTLLLSSPASLPIRLTNALYQSHTHATYPLIHPTTEEYIAPTALRFTRDGTHFIAGCRDELAVFDVSRDGSGPAETYRTTVSKKAKKLYGAKTLGCSGTIMALDASAQDGLLAVGTTSRDVAIYEAEGRGECVTAFSLTAVNGRTDGSGIMQVQWTHDGRYLVAAERQSDVVQVFDSRTGYQRLCRLSGRKADTTQRMRVDVVETGKGPELWAGGTDGVVRMWKDLGAIEGERLPDVEIKMHDDAVSSAVWHPGGAVLATCSGQRHLSVSGADEESSTDTDSSSDDSSVESFAGGPPHCDNTLKVWAL